LYNTLFDFDIIQLGYPGAFCATTVRSAGIPMGLSLAEKDTWSPFHVKSQQCDLDCPASDGADESGSADLPLVPLLNAIAFAFGSTLLLWILARATIRRLRRPGRFYGFGLATQEGGVPGLASAAAAGATAGLPYGSPPTPPPVTWLRDADPAAAAAAPVSYTPYTPSPPVEQLLFSVSPQPPQPQPALGGYGGMGTPAGAVPYYPPVLGGAGAGNAAVSGIGMSSAGPSGASPPGGSRVRRRGPVGWDRGLLSRQSALLPCISSVEGLLASPEFQQHMRNTRRRSPQLEQEQSLAKVQLYKDLRRMDPDAFRRLLSRTDIRSYEVRPPPLALAVVEYLVEVLLLPAGLAAAWWASSGGGSWSAGGGSSAGSGSGSSQQGAGAAGDGGDAGGEEAAAGALSVQQLLMLGPLLAWLGLKLWLAASGHTSLLARATRVYLVYDNSSSSSG
ncbi:hypothetical protein Agub_g13778, partial [Astrephomene gubernaculifera]